MLPYQKLRKARRAQSPKVGLRDIAALLGVPYPSVRHAETPRSAKMTDVVIERVASEWQIPRAWFYNGLDDPIPTPTTSLIAESRSGYPSPTPHYFTEPEHLPCHSLLPHPEGPRADLNCPAYRPIPAVLYPGFDFYNRSVPTPERMVVLQCWVHDLEPRIAYGDILIGIRVANVGYNRLTVVQLPDQTLAIATLRPESAPAFSLLGSDALAPVESLVYAAIYCIWTPDHHPTRKNLEWLFNQVLPAP